jgi:hypothetical protein
MGTMTQFFQFEADFIESLRCIPMQVRLKLDTCGIKLKLEQWNHFSPQERQQLTARPCETAADIANYRALLQQLIWERAGTTATELAIDAHPAWLDATTVPDSVQAQATAHGVTVPLPRWATLTPIQRFALIKLSRSQHENKNFLPALQEFKLL